MIHLYLFGPQRLMEPLAELSGASPLIEIVGDAGEESDATLYERLNERVEARLHAHLNSGQPSRPSSAEGSGADDEVVIVLTPVLGDRFSTIALSIPTPILYVISGVNVGMLSALDALPVSLEERISRPIPNPTHHLDSSPDDAIDDELLADGPRTDVSPDDATLHRAASDSPEEDYAPMSSGSARVELNEAGETVLLTVDPSQTRSLARSDSLARSLCELFKESGRSGVAFLNAFLREEDDESTIDLSILESEFI